MAQALDFIQALPEGFSARLGDGGSRLSGGQLQRLALARALLHQPRVRLLAGGGATGVGWRHAARGTRRAWRCRGESCTAALRMCLSLAAELAPAQCPTLPALSPPSCQVLLLDEPTSALDSQTEAQVLTALEAAMVRGSTMRWAGGGAQNAACHPRLRQKRCGLRARAREAKRC